MRPAQELSLASLATIANSLPVMSYLDFGHGHPKILLSREVVAKRRPLRLTGSIARQP